MNLIIANLTEADLRRLEKAKELDEFTDSDWADWLRFKVKDVYLADDFQELIGRSTKENLAKLWMQNFALNLPDIISDKSLTLNELLPEDIKNESSHDTEYSTGVCPKCPHGSAICVGAGPSITKFNHIKILAKSGYEGIVLTSDRMLIPLLKAGIIPEVTISVDGNREKIVQFYDDPIVDKYGDKLKVALCSTVAHNVVERLKKANAKIYWFHPIFDDYRNIESFTRLQRDMTSVKKGLEANGLPASSCLGCTGSACWVFAHALYRRSPIAFIGMDFGYPGNTPLEETAYFKTLLPTAEKMFGPRAVDYLKANCFREIYNPHIARNALQDIIFIHYREGFLRAAAQTKPWIRTINCTGDGAMFGERVEWSSFSDFLEKYKE